MYIYTIKVFSVVCVLSVGEAGLTEYFHLFLFFLYKYNFYFNKDHLSCSFADCKTWATVCSPSGISSVLKATL